MRADAEQRISESRELRKLFGTTQGVQIKRIRRPRKPLPVWANDDHSLRLHILGPALRRYRIAYLYWRVGMSAREVADEIETTVKAVENVVHKLNSKPAD